MEEHQQQLHRLRGWMTAEKESQRNWHVEELRKYQEKHASDLARYSNFDHFPSTHPIPYHLSDINQIFQCCAEINQASVLTTGTAQSNSGETPGGERGSHPPP